MRLDRQHALAGTAVLVNVFVALVAEEHGPADEADEALYHAGRALATSGVEGEGTGRGGVDLPIVVRGDFADFGPDDAFAVGAVDVGGAEGELFEGSYHARGCFVDWLGLKGFFGGRRI